VSVGLVDSGATVNVLPYELGLQLGGVWEDSRAIIQLAGNLSNQPAMPLAAIAQIREFSPVELVFAWSRNSNVPLILGQTNFFRNCLASKIGEQKNRNIILECGSNHF